MGRDCFNPGRILITGGAGFIGSHLTDHLLRRYPDARITVLDALTYAGRRENLAGAMKTGRLDFVHGSVNDAKVLNRVMAGTDAVFHLAAESHVPRSFDDPDLFDRVNRAGTKAVLEAAAQNGVTRFLHMSTDEVYGATQQRCTEAAELRPTTPYSKSKADAEGECAAFRGSGMDIRILRPANAVGTRQHAEKLLPRFVGHALAGMALPVEGSGRQQRCFVPVGDLVRAMLLVFNHPLAAGGTFNVEGRETLDIHEVAALVSQVAGVPLKSRPVADRAINDSAYMIDGSALEALGYVQQSSVEREIRTMLAQEADWLREAAKPRRTSIIAPPALAPSMEDVTSLPKPIAYHVPHRKGRPGEHLMSVLEGTRLAGGGEHTRAIETRIAADTGAHRVWLTHSCTGAMEVAALALGLGPGDEVVVPSYTFAATATAFARTGARIVLCDVDPATMMLNAKTVEQAITERTRAVVPVHYGGALAPMEEIAALCQPRGIEIVEDAAQSVGVQHRGWASGTFGRFGCYSFHDTKVLHCGQGGALLVNDASEALLKRVDRIMERGTNFSDCRAGLVSHYEWVGPGSSFRPSEMQAALLRDNWEQLDAIIAQRRAIASVYQRMFDQKGLPFRLLKADADTRSNHHIAGLIMDRPDAAEDLIAALAGQGIQAMSHYKPLHLSQEALRNMAQTPHLPGAEHVWKRLVRLPVHAEMTPQDAEFVATCVLAWAARQGLRRDEGLQPSLLALAG